MPEQVEQPLLDVRIAELATAADGIGEDSPQMKDREEPWVYEVNDRITVAVNNAEKNTIDPEGCMDCEAEPFRMILWDNGWLAYLGPQGTSHLGAREAEDRWIEALEAEIEEHGGELSEEASADG